MKGELNGKDPDAGKEWRQEEKEVTEKEIFGCIIEPMDMSLSKLQETVKDWEAWHAAVPGVAKSQIGESDHEHQIQLQVYTEFWGGRGESPK